MSKEAHVNDFGTLVAYLVPGATVLVGFSQFFDQLRVWFAIAPETAPTIGGFLYLTVASLAAGMTVSAMRWATLDTVHGWMGLRPPRLDFGNLGSNVEAYALLIEIHYRHYLYFANMFVATAIAYVCYRIAVGWTAGFGWMDLGIAVLEVVFFITSRDTLRKYHQRTEQLLGGKRR